jgi:anti-sigma B factor antagonist
MMELSTSATATTITVVGDLDLAERKQFPELVARVSGLRRQLLVVDLCRTTFLDSTGAAFLISLAESTDKRGGVTLLRGADERNRFVLEVCGALDMFRLDDDHRCEDDPEADDVAG